MRDANQVKAKHEIYRSAVDGVAVVPATAESLGRVSRALWIGTAGNISVTLESGNTVLLKNIANGTLLPIACTHVRNSGTTATDIVALS